MWPDWVSNPGPLTYESGALSAPPGGGGGDCLCGGWGTEVDQIHDTVSLLKRHQVVVFVCVWGGGGGRGGGQKWTRYMIQFLS